MPEAAKIRALVADDQPSLRTLVRGCLRQMQIEQVVECADGEDAFAALLRAPVHLIISDLNMPRLDGLGLLQKVRSERAMAKTAFIMVTSRAETHLVKEAIRLGVNNYIVKPFNFGGLKAKIEGVFGQLT
jgi:two-component system chemotaxis response regulator CheY